MDDELTLEQIADPLAHLGLIDPKTGAALPTDDWKPDQTESQPDAGASSQTPMQASTAPNANWDSPENPYKRQAEALRQQVPNPGAQIEQAKATMRQQAGLAYEALVNGVGTNEKMDPGLAQVVVQSQLRAAEADLERAVERQAILPVLQERAAAKMAQEFSLGGVEIKPEELAGEGTIDAMRAKALNLWKTRRDGNFEKRASQRVDSAEGGVPQRVAGGVDYDKLSSQQTIKLGLARAGW